MGLRVEVFTDGIDEQLQGLTSDPFGASIPSSVGLRIPSFRQDNVTRYLFLLATRKISAPTRIRGIRQLLTLGASIETGSEPPTIFPSQEFTVVSPWFKAPDGNVSWHLVMEPNAVDAVNIPTFSAGAVVPSTNLMFDSADSPALLFQNIAFQEPVGQGIYYFQDITAYTPPVKATAEWQPIGGLGCMHHIAFPWNASQAWESLDIPIAAQQERRISLYASVLQTSGVAAPTTTSTTFGAFAPETGFAEVMATITGASPVIFWRVAGSIIFEDYEDDPDALR